MKRCLLGLLILLCPVIVQAQEMRFSDPPMITVPERVDFDLLTGSGLKYRDAIEYIGRTCSSVCVSPDGIYVSANHCKFRVNAVYETNMGTKLRCIYNTGNVEGVCVLVDESRDRVHTFIPLADAVPKIGEPVYAIGYPAGKFNYAEARVKEIAISPRDGNTYITIDQRLFEGHSGGPLINDNDQVVGVLSTRSLLPNERGGQGSSPEASFISLESIYDSLKAAGFRIEPIDQETQQRRPKIVVFTSIGCVPCDHFKSDLHNGRFPAEYDFEVVTWNGVNWDKPEYAVGFTRSTGKRVGAYPTFWVEGSTRTQIGYTGPTSLLGFIRDALRFIIGMIIGGEDAGGNVPRLQPGPNPGGPGPIPNLSLVEKILEIKGRVDGFQSGLEEKYRKIQEIEGRVTDLVQRYHEIKPKVELAIQLIEKIKSGEGSAKDLIAVLSELDVVKNKVDEVSQKYGITEEKIETVKSAVQTIKEIRSGEYDLLHKPWVLGSMVISFFVGVVAKRRRS